jgi:hypothetical protein
MSKCPGELLKEKQDQVGDVIVPTIFKDADPSKEGCKTI